MAKSESAEPGWSSAQLAVLNALDATLWVRRDVYPVQPTQKDTAADQSALAPRNEIPNPAPGKAAPVGSTARVQRNKAASPQVAPTAAVGKTISTIRLVQFEQLMLLVSVVPVFSDRMLADLAWVILGRKVAPVEHVRVDLGGSGAAAPTAVLRGLQQRLESEHKPSILGVLGSGGAAGSASEHGATGHDLPVLAGICDLHTGDGLDAGVFERPSGKGFFWRASIERGQAGAVGTVTMASKTSLWTLLKQEIVVTAKAAAQSTLQIR